MTPILFISCEESHPFYSLLTRSGIAVERIAEPEAALEKAVHQRLPLILLAAEGHEGLKLSAMWVERLAAAGVRAILECPGAVEGITLEPPFPADRLLRGVIVSELFDLPVGSLLTLSGAKVARSTGGKPLLVMGRVAGYDSLAFELGETEVIPVLLEVNPLLRVATAELSQFEFSRYAPISSWQNVWRHLLQWLLGREVPLVFEPRVTTRFQPGDRLPGDITRDAVQAGITWMESTRLLVPDTVSNLYEAVDGDELPIPAQWPVGSGAQGILEGYTSGICADGSQKVRWWRRADCNGEAAGAFAIAAKVLGREEWGQVGARLNCWLYEKANLANGDRANPEDPSYGLLGWHDRSQYGANINGWEVYYGDDNARAVLGSLAVSALQRRTDWDRRMLEVILGNFRTARTTGFRGNHLIQEELSVEGWESHFTNTELAPEFCCPHYQAYLWACYLWVYQQTGVEAFYKRSLNAIRTMMERYPAKWRWTYGIQPERARMLLPLAWLVRVNDTPEHRQWLRQMAEDLLASQQESGAILEEIRTEGGVYAPPASHDDYGKNEASLLQQNGDPVADQLYTTNFAFLGLHEAAAATGDPYYQQAADRLADYFLRTQSASASPELDGAWFRAFDNQRWEYWGSDSDGGWGAWCVEVGWTQSWIIQVLGFRALKTSLWALAENVDIGSHYSDLVKLFFGEHAEQMMPEHAIAQQSPFGE